MAHASNTKTNALISKSNPGAKYYDLITQKAGERFIAAVYALSTGKGVVLVRQLHTLLVIVIADEETQFTELLSAADLSATVKSLIKDNDLDIIDQVSGSMILQEIGPEPVIREDNIEYLIENNFLPVDDLEDLDEAATALEDVYFNLRES